jgi:phage terminase large subunit-like protein
MAAPEPDGAVRFNAEEADRVVAFFERVLKHTKSIYAGKPFILAPWQRDEIVRPLYGWQRWDPQYRLWVRKHSVAWIEMGRGGGKSELAAGMALEGFFDGEEGAEIYGAAEDRDQATIVYRVAKRMVELSPILSKRLKVIDSKKRIVDPRTDSFYQVLPRDELGDGSQGFNPHVVVFDEVHVQKGRELIDALRRGMGKRVQPLFCAITTAGRNLASPAYEEHQFAEKVLAGEVEAPHWFAFLRNVPMDADPFDERNWYLANPALGDFLSIETLRQEAAEARVKPSEESLFRTFRLNQWQSAEIRWLNAAQWQANGGPVDVEQLTRRPCYGGLDLASTSDFTAWVLVFPDGAGGYDVLCRFWLPRAAIARHRTLGPLYEQWARDGWLTVTDGDVVDYDAIEAQVLADARDFGLIQAAYDPWNATKLALELQDAGLPMVEHPQTIARMNGPAQELERLLGEVLLRHGDNPVLKWMADTVVARVDAEGRIKPDRKKSTEKIDGIVALVMALGAALTPPEVLPTPSIHVFPDDDQEPFDAA